MMGGMYEPQPLPPISGRMQCDSDRPHHGHNWVDDPNVPEIGDPGYYDLATPRMKQAIRRWACPGFGYRAPAMSSDPHA
jgi:hypothetical protein